MEASTSIKAAHSSNSLANRRTNYTPIGVNKNNLANYTNQKQPARVANTISAEQYIDSTSEDEHEQRAVVGGSAQDLKSSRREWRRDARQQVEPATFRRQQQQQSTLAKARVAEVVVAENDLRQEEEEEEEVSQSELEEVYLCNCCGVTKELEPAMKYLAAFRSLFYLFNFLSFASAFALLGFGLWYRIDPKVYELHKYIETQNFTIAGWIMLFGGFISCLLSLIGCRAASRRSISWLLVYCLIMTTITLAFIGALVLLTVHGLGATLERFMSKEIYDQIRRRAMSTELDLLTGYDAVQFLDFLQVKLRCCGSQDFRDYQKLGMIIPATCYTIAGNYINAPGCARAIRDMFDLRAGLAAGFCAANIVCQMVSALLAALIICSIYNYRANPRPVSSAAISLDSRQETVIKTSPPPQFERQAAAVVARARDYEKSSSRPGSRSSLASIRV